MSSSKMSDEHDGESSRSSVDDGLTPQASTSANHIEAYKPPKKKKKKGEEEVFEWTDHVSNPDFIAASVLQVKHVRFLMFISAAARFWGYLNCSFLSV